MHELPKDLSNNLRSWRGSVYGNRSSTHDESLDLEKQEQYGDKEAERGLSPGPTESSVVLHTTRSRLALQQQAQQQAGQQHPRANAPQGQQHNGQEPPPSTRQLTKRQATVPPLTPASAKKSVFTAPKVDDPDPAADRIADDENEPLSNTDFYELIGMRPPDSQHQNPKELAQRHGLYDRIQRQLRRTQTQYRVYDVLTYALMILQLLLSAVFIVLGSLTRVDSHIAIAVLGAVSTVVAGALALMKGQGLPNRLRQSRDALRNVTFEAEELYWDVGADRQVYFRDIVKLREDYLRVMEEARRNHPDTWNSTATGIAQGVQSKTGKKPTLVKGGTPKL